MLDTANIHLIQKGNLIEKQRPKLPYGHGRGHVSEETEIRKEYRGNEGKASDELRHPDHLNFGKNRFLNSTQKQHYKDTKNDPLTKIDYDKTLDMKQGIKYHGTMGNTLQGKEEHNKKYHKSVMEGENNAKPDAWIRGRYEKNTHKFIGDSKTKTDFMGHNEKFAEKQNERFDNLKPAKDIQLKDQTAYKTRHCGKSPNTTADKELFGHNYTKGKGGHKFLENPEHKKATAYHNHFNETMKGDTIHEKPHFGKDDKTKDFLYQYHKGYYHTDA